MKLENLRRLYLYAGLVPALLVLVALSSLLAPRPVAAQTPGTCMVTSTANDGPGSLRAAIADTNCTTINFAGDATITLASQLKLTRRPLTIDGTGYHVTISGGNTTRVFWANGGSCNNGADYASEDDWFNGEITLKNLTIANGTATNGGGLYYYGNLCYGEDSSEQGGDAWTNHRTYGNLNLINVTFLNNTATSTGGGAFLDNNYDAGVLLGPSAPVLTNVTFSGNSTPNLGGALGILNGGAMMTNLTFVGNSTSAGGAAIWYRYAAWGATDSSGNLTLRLRNTIIWGNTTGSGVSQQYKWIMEQSGGTQLAVSNSDIEGGYSGTGNINLAPRLSALGDYGGSTDTYALLPGSVVIDATSSNCPETDQRGLTRSTPSCDLGAFESQGFTLIPTTGSNQSAGAYKVFATPLALTVTANNADEPVAGGTITFTGPSTGAGTLPAVMTTTIGASGAASVTVRANGTLGGPYAVTATTTDASTASFTGLRNVCASPIVVQNANDSGAGSLREALIAVCAGGGINFGNNFQITLQSDLPVTQSVMIDATPQVVTVSGNSAVRVFNVSAGNILGLKGFTVANGKATSANGGGVYNAGTLNLTNMTFRDNTAAYGGGVYNAGNLIITNSTFSANSASFNGGALYNAAGTPVLTNVTMGNNTAASGGGIYNSNSSLTVRNSIVWGGSGGAIVNVGTGSATVTYSAVQGGYAGTGNTSSDPLLSSLGRYATSMLDTFALLPGSAAIDAANSAYCSTTDQRSMSRVGTCDMGAFESQGFTIGRISGRNQSTAVNTAFPTLLLLGVTPRVSREPVAGGKVTITGPSSGASIAPSSFVATVNADSEIEETLMANGIAGGPYIITATAAGAGDPMIINGLVNTKGTTTLILTSSLNPSLVSQNVAFTATLAATGTPTGFVQFYVDGAAFGSAVALSAGRATVNTSSLTNGTHSITATYAGDDNFSGSTSNEVAQVVTCLAAVTVTTASDSGSGSLREAITYLCPNGTITFASNTTVTLAGTLTIAKNLTIDGTGYDVTLSGGNAVRVFSVSGGYTLNLVDLTVANGRAAGASGGGTYNAGTLNLSGVTFHNNTATSGGAIYNGGTLAATNSTFYGNSATSAGGALDNAAGSATLTHVTISGNTAASGGGVYNVAGLTIRNSILWGSGALANVSGGSATVTYSVVQGGYSGTGNTVADPLLAPLADYGGETQTQALLPGSSAIDKVSTNCATTDQRGIARSTTACDMGAFESRGTTLTLVSGNNQSTSVNSVFSAALQVRVNETGGSVLQGATITFTGPSSGASTNPAGFTATTGATGIATATATANGTIGGPYTVSASVPGATSVSFSLTNLCAGVVTVTNANDSGTGSLREALSSSSVVCLNGTITFAGDYTITLASTLTNAKAVTVDGTGHSVVVSGSNARRVFSVANGYTLGLKGFTVANGAAPGASGGGAQNLGTLTLTNMTFRNNAAANGGAVYNGGTLTVSNSTFYGNSAGNGGALYGGAGTATLTHVTLVTNTATNGGAVYNGGSTVIVDSSILWGGSSGVSVINGTGTTTVTYSAVQGSYNGTGNTNADPLLAPFANYGGGTQTIALLPGSPAMDTTSTGCSSDQRGVTRSNAYGSTCDMGAFESSGFTFTNLSGAPQSTTINTVYAQPLATTVMAKNSVEPVAGGIVSYTVINLGSGASVSLTGNPVTIPANGRVSVTVAANGIAGVTNVSARASGARATSGADVVYFVLRNLCTSSVVVTTAADNGTGSLREAVGGVCDGGTVTFDDDYTIELESSLITPHDRSLSIDGIGHDVTISGNNAVQAIYVLDYTFLGLNQLTVANGVATNGGGVYVDAESTLNATNVAFRHNSATSNGGAIYVVAHGTLNATNCTFQGNSATGGGNGIYNAGSSSTVRNSILWGGTGSVIGGSATVTYSDVQGGYSGTGNIDVDPAFIAAGGDLRLRHDSPAIDTGDTAGVTATTDLAGNPRVMGTAVDMGAYEVQQATRSVSAGTWFDFGPELCGRIWFTNTGTLPTSVAITLTYEMPFTITGASLLDRRYQIDAQGGAGYQAMVELCYDADDLTHGGIADAVDLVAYRNGVRYSPSSVDTADRIVTAFGVTGFSVWTLGDSPSPTAVRMHVLSATGTTPAAVPLGFVAVATVVGMVHRRRRS